MKYHLCALGILIAGLTATHAMAAAGVEITTEKNFDISAPPIDTVVSRDGKYLYLLTREGKILVYTTQGQLAGTLNAPPGTERIIASPKSDLLYLIRGKTKKVDVARIEFIHDIDITGSPVKGAADAPVVMVVFSDFQCPYCARLAPVLDAVLKKYPDKVKLIFKNYPLKMHKFAREAGIAALAADAQGKFWPFHDRLFRDYTALNEEKVKEIAVSVGLDMAKFEQDRKRTGIAVQMKKDAAQAIEMGISGVPAVYVDGRLVRTRSLEGIGAAIEEAFASGK